ncbi:DUF3800 domain-containing protein [Pseudomonas sp. B2M1-30]|uniref:DUF3800 domain-containing protein n=1 Tax=Pseudomonas TaxID=286 RepID=UPI0021CA779C|nr:MULTISPECIES: DUF3800 domain-containing protein [Pseudomonas]MCU0118147.1 DUF3800 domain-containing protein [Pseudomonas sp. B2M1-30]MCU7264367.1 DUF3800 domain-containing protein [Pseudomonas koreensis]
MNQAGKFSDFIVYVDESGDQGMQTLDAHYPIFVLAFCAFHKRHYCEQVIPALQKFKFDHMGHDLVGLHELDIRKEKGALSGLFASRQHKTAFLDELTDIINASNFILISCVIDKASLREKQGFAQNPYHLALGCCLETLYEFLQEKNQQSALTHVIFERRGKREDNELEFEFRQMCEGMNRWGIQLPFDIIFATKQVNSTGLQFADLVARPIGMSVLRPGQENRAFDVLKRKFYCSGGRSRAGEGVENWGLKLFPSPESEKPQ